MKKFLLIAGVAAMAASMPAMAKPDNKGGGGGQGAAAKAAKPQKANGGGAKAQRARPQQASFARAKPEKAQRQQVRNAQRQVRAERRQVERAQRARVDDRRDWTEERERLARVRWDDRFGDRTFRQAGAFCPPGLAKKGNGCLPPGQAKKVYSVGQRLTGDWFNAYNVPMAYRSFYHDTPDYYYRYDDNGYIYRVDRDTNLVSSLIPLLGGGFAVGQPLPMGYDIYNVPYQYRDTYYDTDDYYYRYGDGAIYQVDPETRMIESVVALMTGTNLGVGQMLPAGYDVYNVPYPYRDQYYDTDDYMYRYADGYIYQVDPQTQIIQAIISALI